MALSSNQYALIVQRLETILAQKAAAKVLEWTSYGNFGKVTQNPHFLKKERRGDQKKIFQKSPKFLPSLKRPKSTLAQMALSSNQYALIVQRLEKILAQNAAPKVLESPSYGNFGKVTQNPHFLKKERRGDQRKFFKRRQKTSPRLKGPKALCRKWHYLRTSMLLRCKDWRRFWRRRRLQKCPNGDVMAIFARSPKTRTFLKSAKGGPREIFQKSPKKQPSFEKANSTLAQIALSSNQYALKVQKLEKIQAQTAATKVPEWPSYGNFRKVTQNPHFVKKCKRGTKRNFSKIAQKVALV